ncbi:MAG: endonuclease/exonuclease/phosphatase family protein [Alphaproteobacteria bacterium]|nr:endonuclease/exonuclease/phosphatase family protein [Alphaproteobacteria bacterium]
MPVVIAKLLSREWLPLLVAGGALAAFTIGYFGWLTPSLDFFAQFTAHWLMIAVVAVVASFATRQAYAILSASLPLACLVPILLTAWYAAPPLPSPGLAMQRKAAVGLVKSRVKSDNTSAASTIRPRFKLVTYNTYNHNADAKAVWSAIEQHDADVLVLIEFGPNKAKLKQRLLAKYPHYKGCDADWNCALAIFSRLPVTYFHLSTPYADEGPMYIRAEVGVGGQTVTVIGTHVLSPNHGPKANYRELDYLAGLAQTIDGHLVLAGDLNTTLWANAFDNLRRKSGLVHMGHLIPTWPALPLHVPQIGIDHILTSPGLKLLDARVGRSGGSDHLPLAATIELPQ